jgi:hypothetical protein
VWNLRLPFTKCQLKSGDTNSALVASKCLAFSVSVLRLALRHEEWNFLNIE